MCLKWPLLKHLLHLGRKCQVYPHGQTNDTSLSITKKKNKYKVTPKSSAAAPRCDGKPAERGPVVGGWTQQFSLAGTLGLEKCILESHFIGVLVYSTGICGVQFFHFIPLEFGDEVSSKS